MNLKSVPCSKPRLRWPLAATIIVLLACGLAIKAYSNIQGVIEGPIAVKQLQDDPIDYAIGQTVASANVPGMIATGAVLTLIALWSSYVARSFFCGRGNRYEFPTQTN